MGTVVPGRLVVIGQRCLQNFHSQRYMNSVYIIPHAITSFSGSCDVFFLLFLVRCPYRTTRRSSGRYLANNHPPSAGVRRTAFWTTCWELLMSERSILSSPARQLIRADGLAQGTVIDNRTSSPSHRAARTRNGFCLNGEANQPPYMCHNLREWVPSIVKLSQTCSTPCTRAAVGGNWTLLLGTDTELTVTFCTPQTDVNCATCCRSRLQQLIYGFYSSNVMSSNSNF